MAKRPRKSAKSTKSAKQVKADEGTEQDRLLLDQLKEIGARIGLEVREERLVREVGYSVHSGRCRVKGVDVILLDRNVAIGERTDAMLESLAGCDLAEIYVEPELRQLIQSRPGNASDNDADDAENAGSDDSATSAQTDERSSGA